MPVYIVLQMSGDEMKLRSQVQSAYFHYHHDEVQYWLLVIAQFTPREQNERVNTEPPPIDTGQSNKTR